MWQMLISGTLYKNSVWWVNAVVNESFSIVNLTLYWLLGVSTIAKYPPATLRISRSSRTFDRVCSLCVYYHRDQPCYCESE